MTTTESNKIIYRQLNPAEWPEYKRLRLQALQRVPHAFGSTYAEAAAKPDEYWRSRLSDSLSGSKCYFLFALDGQRVVGMTGAWWDRELGIVEIVAVYVDEEYQRRGIAKGLLQGVLARVSENKTLRVARLQMNQKQEAAFRLYQSAGFSVVKEIKFPSPDGVTYDDYIMERELREPAPRS